MSNIQITEELFLKLVKYHLLGVDEVKEDIQKGLKTKLDKLEKRQAYTLYKTATTVEERKKAKKEYNILTIQKGI